jgi:hypothetical protein
MFTKTTILFLAVFLLFANTHTLLGQPDAAAGDRRIKAKVNKLGAGAKVTVSLKDGTKVKGSISQILEDSFDVTLEKQTRSSIISYRDVKDVNKRGWPTSVKVAIGIGIGATAIVAILAALLSADDLFRIAN